MAPAVAAQARVGDLAQGRVDRVLAIPAATVAALAQAPAAMDRVPDRAMAPAEQMADPARVVMVAVAARVVHRAPRDLAPVMAQTAAGLVVVVRMDRARAAMVQAAQAVVPVQVVMGLAPAARDLADRVMAQVATAMATVVTAEVDRVTVTAAPVMAAVRVVVETAPAGAATVVATVDQGMVVLETAAVLVAAETVARVTAVV